MVRVLGESTSMPVMQAQCFLACVLISSRRKEHTPPKWTEQIVKKTVFTMQVNMAVPGDGARALHAQ